MTVTDNLILVRQIHEEMERRSGAPLEVTLSSSKEDASGSGAGQGALSQTVQPLRLKSRLIATARVPIVTLTCDGVGGQSVLGQGGDEGVDCEGGNADTLEADVSANKGGGLHHCLLMRYLAHEHQGLEETIILLKLWLKRRALPGPRHGGIPTTVWSCLAVHVFQIGVNGMTAELAGSGAGAGAEGAGRIEIGCRPVESCRDGLLRLFGLLADATSHLYTHKVDINVRHDRMTLEPAANAMYMLSSERRDRFRKMAGGRLWPWACDAYVSGLSVKDPYDERELVPRVGNATWVLVWHEVHRAHRLLQELEPSSESLAALMAPVASDLHHVCSDGVGYCKDKYGALFLMQNWFVLGIVSRACRPRKRMSNDIISRHDTETVLHVQLLAIQGGGGGGGGGMAAVVEEDEILVNACHFVTRVGMKAVSAPQVETEDAMRYGNPVQAGSQLLFRQGEWQRVLGIVYSVWPGARKWEEGAAGGGERDGGGSGGGGSIDQFLEEAFLAPTSFQAHRTRKLGSEAQASKSAEQEALEKALGPLPTICRPCEDRRRAQEQRQQRLQEQRAVRQRK